MKMLCLALGGLLAFLFGGKFIFRTIDRTKKSWRTEARTGTTICTLIGVGIGFIAALVIGTGPRETTTVPYPLFRIHSSIDGPFVIKDGGDYRYDVSVEDGLSPAQGAEQLGNVTFSLEKRADAAVEITTKKCKGRKLNIWAVCVEYLPDAVFRIPDDKYSYLVSH